MGVVSGLGSAPGKDLATGPGRGSVKGARCRARHSGPAVPQLACISPHFDQVQTRPEIPKELGLNYVEQLVHGPVPY